MMYPEAKEKANRKKNVANRFKAFAAAHNAALEKKQNGRR